MARKRGMQYIPYDYEAAYNKAMEDMFYIHARMRKRRSTGEKTDKTDKTGIEKSRFV